MGPGVSAWGRAWGSAWGRAWGAILGAIGVVGDRRATLAPRVRQAVVLPAVRVAAPIVQMRGTVAAPHDRMTRITESLRTVEIP